MKYEFKKILDYKNQNYKVVGEVSPNEYKHFFQKHNVSFIFKVKRIIKNGLFLILNLFSKKKIALVSSRSLRNVEKKYDFIAGEYIKRHLNYKNLEYPCDFGDGKKIYKIQGIPSKFSASYILKILKETNSKSFMEIGAGELTNIFEIYKNNNKEIVFDKILALDLSLSRLKSGKKFLNENFFHIDYCIKSNAENIPLSNNSVDLLFTIHCLEQVPHIAKYIIKEMIRVSKKYVVLIEPSYQYGSHVTRKRIFKKNYVKIDNDTFKDLDAKVVYREKNKLSSYTSSSEIVILEKNKKKNYSNNFNFICPICKNSLIENKNSLTCLHDKKIYKKFNEIYLFD